MQITEFTRRNVVDYLLLQERPFRGKVGLLCFLKRIWDLSSLPSTDPRLTTAEGDINKHLILNDDWDFDYLLQDYLDLPRAELQTFVRFLEMCVHPGVTLPGEDVAATVEEINAFLHLDGCVLRQQGEIAGRPLYQLLEIGPMATPIQPHDPDNPQPPFDPQALAETLIEMFMAGGAAREVAVLTFASETAFSDWRYDNWDGGTYFWTYTIRIPPRLYGRLSSDDVASCEHLVADAARDLFKGIAGHGLEVVRLSVAVRSSPTIREEALHWLNGEGVNNQGRVRSTNIAARQEDGLLFRSQPEIHLYRALKHRGVTMAPLPVFLRGGETYTRIEPDFILFSDKVLMVVEVDGDTVHRETPAEADQRLCIFKHEGAVVERIPASSCDTQEKANTCATRLLLILEKLKGHR